MMIRALRPTLNRARRKTKTWSFGLVNEDLQVVHIRHGASSPWSCCEPWQREPRRHFSNSSDGGVERFRVAIVGGGAAGLSTALHLAPLAAAGYIESPIDLFEAMPSSTSHPSTPPQSDSAGLKTLKSPGSGSVGRSVGVGVWNTALEPFAMSERQTHLDLVKQLEHDGRWVGRVGYRTPDGHWLARSELDTTLLSSGDAAGRPGARQPGLLFLREVDLLSALRAAVRTEEDQHATIRTHYGAAYSVEEIVTNANIHPASGRLVFADGSLSPRSYHMVVAAGGMKSKLRSQYAGHCFKRRRGRSRPSGMALGSDREPDPYFDRKKRTEQNHAVEDDEWDNYSHNESNAVEDRQYTVFRGNAPLTDLDVAPKGGGPHINFQTWGTGSSMRFASVGMSRPNPAGNGRIEEQVWFATTSDPRVGLAADATGRKELLKRAFSGWHDPVARLIASTPPDQIFVDRAVAHKHSVRPVLDLSEILAYERRRRQQQQGRHSDLRRSRAFRRLDEPDGDGSSLSEPANMLASQIASASTTTTITTGGAATGDGPGPVLVFVGDASLTIDPVLAQGFTVAMEAAADLAKTIERCCDSVPSTTSNHAEATKMDGTLSPAPSNFNPRALRDELVSRHDRRYRRLLCLLRATELVQALAQPHSGSPMGWFSRAVIRPAMWATPQWMKKPIFDSMIRYSLGLWESNPTSLAFVPPPPEKIENEKNNDHDDDNKTHGNGDDDDDERSRPSTPSNDSSRDGPILQ